MRRLLLFVCLAVSACNYDEDDYDLTRPGILVMQADRTSIPADGISVATLTVTISPEASDARRVIVVTTTAGKLIGGEGTEDTAKKITVDAGGHGTIQLQSIPTATSARVAAQVENLPATLQVLSIQFSTPNPNDIIRFTAAPQQAPADDATVSEFVIEVPNFQLLPVASRIVQFTTTAGKFPGDKETESVPLDTSGRASIQLRSPSTPGTAIVRAKVNDVTTSASITFVRALPESVDVVPQEFAVEGRLGDSMTIDTFVRRGVGEPSPGSIVTFTALKDDGTPLGLFRSARVTVDADNKATTVYTPGDTDYRGDVTIRAQVDGTNVVGTAVIRVIDPPPS